MMNNRFEDLTKNLLNLSFIYLFAIIVYVLISDTLLFAEYEINDYCWVYRFAVLFIALKMCSFVMGTKNIIEFSIYENSINNTFGYFCQTFGEYYREIKNIFYKTILVIALLLLVIIPFMVYMYSVVVIFSINDNNMFLKIGIIIPEIIFILEIIQNNLYYKKQLSSIC